MSANAGLPTGPENGKVRQPDLDPPSAEALARALATVATAREGRPSAAQVSVVEGFSRLLLGVNQPFAMPGCEPGELAAAITTEYEREFAAQLLVLAALVDEEPAHECRDACLAFSRALGQRPENLAVLHDVVHRRIRRAHWHLYRRFLVDGLRTGSLSGDLEAVHDLVRERQDHPEIAEPYLALECLPEDTFGNHFFQFRMNRGFNFPGQKGALPTAYGFELHDSMHVLSGYNTTSTDEINVVAFQAGASSTLPWLLIAVNLITFNSGLPYGPVGLLHYEPERGRLDPDAFVRAFERGLGVRRDLSRDFDLMAAWQMPLEEVREQLGIVGAGDVRKP